MAALLGRSRFAKSCWCPYCVLRDSPGQLRGREDRAWRDEWDQERAEQDAWDAWGDDDHGRGWDRFEPPIPDADELPDGVAFAAASDV